MPNEEESMDVFVSGLVSIFKILLALIFLAFALEFTARWLAPAPPAAVVQLTAEERLWIKDRHRFHGISASIVENGERYFIRDGKKCRL